MKVFKFSVCWGTEANKRDPGTGMKTYQVDI